MEKITIKIEKMVYKKSERLGSYGVWERKFKHWMVVKDENGNTYTISTSKPVFEGDTITASIKGEGEYKGVKQLNLTRVTDIICGEEHNEWWNANKPVNISGLISTEGGDY